MLKGATQLNVESTLPVLAFNFEGLKTWAESLTKRYADLVVTEDEIADAKRDMAELNKNKARLEEARKETVRRVSEPIRAFESQIKDVVGLFDAAYAKLGSQVRAFEDAQREEKRNKVQELIGQCFADAFGAHGDWPDFEIPVQEKWLNKTTSLKAVREDVAAIIQRHIEEEQRKAALEQARQDRAAAIENHVKGLNEKHGLNLPVSRFIVNMGSLSERPLADVLADIDQAYADALDQREKQRQAMRSARPASGWPTPPKQAPDEQAAPEAERPAAPASTRAMSIVIQYETSKEAQVKACLENLKKLCVNYGARRRPDCPAFE